MFRRLKLAWRIAQGFPYIQFWADKPWTQADALNYQSFAASATGKHFAGRLNNLSNATALWAVRQRPGQIRTIEYDAGYAAGVDFVLGYIDRHLPQPISQVAADSDETEEEAHNADAFSYE